MIRIMLCCSAGMSTSMLVRKMVEVADQRGLAVQIDAWGIAEFDTQFPTYQVVLLGPQVKYMLNTLSEKAATHGIPVRAIDMTDYGMQRGDNVLDYALSLIEATH
ncbi:PTS system cellobiose-specific IIB component [Pantoea sp. PNA 14-12]|uniref:PTS lactose transporter subunit IIB n=1 Tax=Pantoea stewartii TaxID=66269 RepID=A0AB34VLW5_9GAMM|nr:MULTISPECIES: PTS sugar transporter subunit IIB [Pantoea]KGD85388.1 PTS lactose transporter subunit IIB [Pantoea stewartii subsp. indologenes]KHE02498.1 PTS lactose transporter subunit IIB [Pantoea stewartii]KHN63828.1 PTS lactose transporter subunit IIB [Pantoea stewartii]KTS75937.1 PTS lactose transporter subunit IIB [Pantoea stewartii]KTT01750.1 PTS lactose transporter subunit IIB [Pantoea stewartii]